jgi:hypothetical protein
MRIALRRVLILASSLFLLQIASDVWPQGNSVSLSGAGYIDYRDRPKFKVGDWVKYKFTSKSDDGSSEDYDLTILISGEEKFWGEECFWVETWAGGRTLMPKHSAVLLSYAVFGDTAWLQRLQVYQRKEGNRDEDGNLTQELTHRVLGGRAIGETRQLVTVLTDTLGTDTVSVAGTLYRCTKVNRKAGVGSVEEVADSTIRRENWDHRTLYLSTRVPMTSLVRELDERWITRRAWLAGKSAEARQSYQMRGTGKLDLVSFGHGGVEPELTPLYARKPTAREGGSRPGAAAGKPPARKRR